MTNVYVVGEADVAQALQANPDVRVVVTLSMWNTVSDAARTFGRTRKVGVFGFRELLGALNYEKYWLYESLPVDTSDSEDAHEKQRRRREWN